MLDYIEKISLLLIPHYKLLISKRFFPVVFSVAIGLITSLFIYNNWLDLKSIPASVYTVWFFIFALSLFWGFLKSPSERKLYKSINSAIVDLRILEAKHLTEKTHKFLFISPSAKICFGLIEAATLREQGDLLQSYEKLKKLKNLALLPKESIEIDIALTYTLFRSGNNKSARLNLDILLDKKLTDEQSIRVILLESELKIANNNIQKAKDLLEENLFKSSLTNSMRFNLLHQLALCETHQNNYESAASYYRQSFELQKKKIKGFAQAERTVDNLILNYARQGKLTEIEPYLLQLEQLINPDNLDHLLAFNNIKLNLARQLDDRHNIIATYEEAKKKILPKLNDEQRFYYQINNLRMNWNDDIDFEQALQQSMHEMLHHPEISTLQKLNTLKEVTGTIKQVMNQIGTRPDLMTYYSWLIMEWQRLQPEIDQLLDEIPVTLPGARDQMLRFKMESIKHKLFFQPPQKHLFDKIFELLCEQKKLWQGMHNGLGQLEALTLTIDEYISFCKQLNNPHFNQDFKQQALNALDEAKTLLERHDDNLAYGKYFIGMAYFSYKLNTNKEQAKIWLEKFDNIKLSLNHYSIWLRKYYQEAKNWVDQT